VTLIDINYITPCCVTSTDRIYGECTSTGDIYLDLIAPIVSDAMRGINGTSHSSLSSIVEHYVYDNLLVQN